MHTLKMSALVAVLGGMLMAVPTAVAAPPVNDDFQRAAVVGDAPFWVSGTVGAATVEAGEPDHGPQSVWYVFKPQRTGRVALRLTEPATGSAGLRVYTGSALSALTPVRVWNGPLYARSMFDAIAGRDYRVAVVTDCGSVPCPDGARSRFALGGEWIVPPRNDAFASARRIRPSGSYRGNLGNATTETGEHAGNRHSLWYRFRPRRTATLTITLALAAYDPQMQLYTGRKLAKLKLVKAAGPSGEAPLHPMRVTVRRGVLYHLAVDASEMNPADFVLELSSSSA